MSLMQFETETARKTWSRFERDLNWSNRNLPAAEQREALAEASAHIRDTMIGQQGDEHDRLTNAIKGFGDLPEAPPVWRMPLAVALHYAAILVIGVIGLFLTLLLHMAVMDVFQPDQVGLWIYEGGSFSLSYEAQSDAREVLGWSFAPIILLVTSITGAGLYGIWRLALAPSGPVSRWMHP
jgi:hypothetical protein